MSFFCFMILFIDTETTGLSSKPNMHEIIQLGGLLCNNRHIIESISIKCQPTAWSKISKQALDVTNLSIDTLKSYPEPQEMFSFFYEKIISYKKRIKLAGQNVKFDTRFLEKWWNMWKTTNQHNFLDVFDVEDSYELMEITKPLKELGILLVDNVKLGTVANALEIKPDGDLHDAMTDIRLTHQTMFDLIDRISWLNNSALNNQFKKYINLK